MNAIMTQLRAGVLALPMVLAGPASAQDGDVGNGFDLLGEGTRMILEGLLDEVRPMLDDMQPFLQEEVLPMWERLAEVVDDLRLYELPEVLPNGDIIMRRRSDAPPYEPLPEVGEGGDVEL